MVTGIQSVTETKANKSPAPSTLKDRPTFGSRLITVKVYNFPSNTPGAIDISKNSFKKTKLQNFFWTTFNKKVAKKSTFCAHEVFNAKISEFFLKKIKKIIK